MKTDLRDVFKRVHGSRDRIRKEKIRRNRAFKQRYAKMLSNNSGEEDEFDSVNVGTKSKKKRRRMPKGALPVWKTADPTFGAPSPQSIYCSIFLLAVSVCICLPELINALGHVNKSWFSSYLSYGPQLAVIVNIVLTFWSICCYSRCCMTLAFILTLSTIPFIAVQMGIVSIPAVMSFCCCFPEKCNGESHSVNSAFHMNVHNPHVIGTKNGSVAEACDYLNSVPSKTQCVKENGLLILYWTGVTLLLVSTSFLSASQYHWRLEKVWLNRAKEKIIQSRFQDDSSGSSSYDISSSDASYSNSDDEIGEDGRKNYLKSKSKSHQRRKHKKSKKKVSFSASTKRHHSLSASSSDDDNNKRKSSRMNAEERTEEVTRLLELAKVKTFNKKARKNQRAKQRPQSARLNSSNQFNNTINSVGGGRSHTARVSSLPVISSARQWSNRHDVGGNMNFERHPREEIGVQGSNQFSSTRSNAHETIYTNDNGANHRVNV
jgi:hypothetical protein